MSAVPTQLTDDTSTSNPASTASINPAAGNLITVAVAVTKTGGPLPAEGDVSISGLGLTWELQSAATVGYRVRRRLYVFRAQGTPSGPDVLSISYTGAATFQEMQWSVTEWSGVAVGNNGADAIGNPGSNSVGTGSTELTCTTTYGPNPGDVTFSIHAVEESGGTPTLEAGWTELSRRESANVRHMIAAWDAEQDTSATISWTSSSNGAGNIIMAIIAGENGVPEVSATIPLGLAVDPATQVEHQASAAVSLGLAVGATAQVEHRASVTIPLGLVVSPATQVEHQASAAVPLGLAVGAVVEQPDTPTVPEVITAIPLGLAVGVTAQAEHQASTTVPLGLAVNPAAGTEHQVTTAIPLGLAVGAVTSDPQPGRPVAPFPGPSGPVTGFPWPPRPVDGFPPGRPVRSFSEVPT